jgi:predicted nucleotidyltransferase
LWIWVARLDNVDNMSTIVDTMSTNRLVETLFPRTRTGVFRELFRDEEGLHLRELERRTGVNARHLVRELHALDAAGILASKRVGNLLIYRFNKECPIYEDIRSLIRKTVGLGDVLREMLAPFHGRISFAYIYGSHARGEEGASSDVDLMIVGDVSLRQISSAMRRTSESLDREISPTIYTPNEYAQAIQDKDSFASRVHSGPRIDLMLDSEHEQAGRHGHEGGAGL